MKQWFEKFSLATKTTAVTIVALLCLSTATFIGGTSVLNADGARTASERQEANMRVAWHVLRQYGTTFRTDGTALYAGTQKLNDFYEPVDKVKELVGGTATIFMGDQRVSTNVTKPEGGRAVGTKLNPGPAYDAVLKSGESYRGETDILGKPFYTAYDPIRDADGKVIGVLYVGLAKAEVMAGLADLNRMMGIVSLVAALIVVAAAYLFNRRSFRPLETMTTAMQTLARGSTDFSVPAKDRQDEIGRMAHALETFRESAIAKEKVEAAARQAEAEQSRAITTLNQALARVSAGDLTAEVGDDFPANFAALRRDYNAALASLRQLIGSVAEGTVSIRTGSSEIAAASEDLARRTESNAATLEETSAAITQMNGRLSATAVAAGQTLERAGTARNAVGSGRSVADEAVGAMTRVAESARGIDEVIEGLDKIAFQTRVLAMNAAVEAGRAGEAGRGFAVVADLVSALAMRSEEEAQNARSQLTVTQVDITTAVEAVQKVDLALAEIVSSVDDVHDLLGSIANDNSAQASAISEINNAIIQMDQATQQNAAMVEETSAAARNLMDQVGGLANKASEFTVDSPRGGPRHFVPAATSAPAVMFN